jgi:hypothetical protein
MEDSRVSDGDDQLTNRPRPQLFIDAYNHTNTSAKPG